MRYTGSKLKTKDSYIIASTSLNIALAVCLLANICNSSTRELELHHLNCQDSSVKGGVLFKDLELNHDNVKLVCDSILIFPEIVTAQSVLETGHYSSNICLKNNNILGLYDSKNKQYYFFNHWTESIIAYKNMIEYKYTEGEDYYLFLTRIGYAEDPDYIEKIKSIENKLFYGTQI